MKKQILYITCLIFSVVLAYAQKNSGSSVNKTGSNRIDFILDDESVETRQLLGDTVSRSLYKVVVNTFEQVGEWYSMIPSDLGYVVSRRQLGAPLALEKQDKNIQVPPSQVQPQDQKKDKRPPRFRRQDGSYHSSYFVPYEDKRRYILGVKASFNRRGSGWFGVYPYRPIRLEGLVKSLEVWVVGRQKNHRLYAIMQDYYGQDQLVLMGHLNFLGWKRLNVNVPTAIKQYDKQYTEKRGLSFKGFLVKTDPTEAPGDYYIYFDNFSAEVSRFWEEYQDQKDPLDIW